MFLKFLCFQTTHDEIEVWGKSTFGIDGEDHTIGIEGSTKIKLYVAGGKESNEGVMGGTRRGGEEVEKE